MRPKTLVLEGFRSHRESTEISFEDRSLIAIVGPIGAGKSTILDGISYALYGKTPRVQRATRELICTGSEQARAQLVFQVEGVEYEVTRVISRSSRGGAHVFVDGNTGEKTTGEAAVTKKVEEVLGLDFDAFGSSVLLAQNQFARFLEADNASRTNILKGVFRLDQVDQMRAAAREQRDASDRDLAKLTGELGAIPEDIEERLQRLDEEVATIQARGAHLREALEEEMRLTRSLEQSAVVLAAAEEAAAAARTALGQVPDVDTLTEIAVQDESLTAELVERKIESESASALVEKAGRLVKDLEEEIGAESRLQELLRDAQSYVATGKKIKAAEASLAEMQARQATAAQSRARALERERAAAAAHEEAAAAFQATQNQHMAHALREHLAEGAPCPVCEQDVPRLPTRRSIGSLEEAADLVQLTKEALERARAELQEAATEEAALQSAVHSQRGSLKVLENEILELRGALGSFADTEDPSAEISTRLDRIRRSREEVEIAQRALNAALSAYEETRQQAQASSARRTEVAAVVIRVCDRAGIDSPGIGDAAAQLIEAAESASRALADAIERAESSRKERLALVTEMEETLLKLRAEAGVLESSSIAVALTELATELGARTNEATRLKADLKRRAKLIEESAVVGARLATFEQLHKDLAVPRFVSFLLTGRKRLLAELASERLSEMTNGRYRFTSDGEFKIIDAFRADTVRPARSLSGGETFLASLALALGLADAVGRNGGRLQCFFLDEGFGSLDAESFERALDGIEHLVSDHRLIALVSHLPALSQRVDDKIQLEREDDGSTRMMSGARL